MSLKLKVTFVYREVPVRVVTDWSDLLQAESREGNLAQCRGLTRLTSMTCKCWLVSEPIPNYVVHSILFNWVSVFVFL